MNYRQIPAALAALQTFNHTSMSARNRHGYYTVWSYKLPIYKVNTYTGEVVTDLLDQTWSRTTTRHQNLVKEHLASVYGRQV